MQIRNRIRAASSAIGASALLAATAAQAAVPAGVTTMFADVGDDFETVAALGWTAFTIIVGGLVIFKIVKKVLGKAT